METYWYTKAGALSRSKRDRYICITQNTEFSYTMSVLTKTGALKIIVAGDLTRVSAMFERYTIRPLELPSRDGLYNAYLAPCEWGALYKQQGVNIFIKHDKAWKPVKEKIPPTFFYYNEQKCPCAVEDATERFIVTPLGDRYAIETTGCILRTVPFPFKNKRNYFTKDMKETTAPNATFRINADASTGMCDVYVKNLSTWVRHSTIPAFYVKQEILSHSVISGTSTYRNDEGKSCDADEASYAVVEKIPGTLQRVYKEETLVTVGTPRDVEDFFEKQQVVKALTSLPVADGKLQGQLINTIWNLCKNTTHIKRENLADSVLIMCNHNRYIKGGPVFNTLLYDDLYQPIYIVDRGYGKDARANLSELRMVRSLSEAQAMCSDIKELPQYFRWSSNPADMVWNPSIPLQPVTQHQMEHICVDNITRLPDELQNLDTPVLMQAIKQEVEKGVKIAACDARYALPIYSADLHRVSMVLPVHIPLLYGNRIVACAILDKSELGYRLVTLITVGMAKISVATLTDITNTWLGGINNDTVC